MVAGLTTLLYSEAGPIAFLSLNRPDRRNAISPLMRDELDLVLDHLDSTDDVRVLVISAEGPDFCSGYDLGPGAFDALVAPEPPGTSRRRFHVSRERWLRLWRLRQVTIGVVHGRCLAGGTDLLGVLDIVFCATDALIGHPQNRSMGLAHTLGMYPLHLSPRHALEWLLTGDSMTGAEAAAAGLANRAVPAEQLPGVARAFADRVAEIPLDILWSVKDATHRWYEAMGISAGMAAAADLDAIDLAGPGMDRFRELVREQGLVAAIEERDRPFRDHRTYWDAYVAGLPERAAEQA